VNISLYTAEQEERLFIRREARAWARSGLITDDQLRIIDARTDPGLNRTNVFFRILFFLFTGSCVQAMIGFYAFVIGIRGDIAIACSALAFGVVMAGLAETLVRRKSLYRYGIEEALALSGMALICAGIVIFISQLHVEPQSLITTAAMLASAGAFWMYLRFGFPYAAVISVACVCVGHPGGGLRNQGFQEREKRHPAGLPSGGYLSGRQSAPPGAGPGPLRRSGPVS